MSTIMATQDAPLPSLQKTSAGASANAREKGRHYYANNRESELARQREMYVSLLDEQGQLTNRGRGRPRKQQKAPRLRSRTHHFFPAGRRV
jgi:hypothetical protein